MRRDRPILAFMREHLSFPFSRVARHGASAMVRQQVGVAETLGRCTFVSKFDSLSSEFFFVLKGCDRGLARATDPFEWCCKKGRLALRGR